MVCRCGELFLEEEERGGEREGKGGRKRREGERERERERERGRGREKKERRCVGGKGKHTRTQTHTHTQVVFSPCLLVVQQCSGLEFDAACRTARVCVIERLVCGAEHLVKAFPVNSRVFLLVDVL